MPAPLVSILMPVYNSFDFVRSENNKLLPRALEAILTQTYTNFELIILDNQSTDDTAAVCKQYAEQDSRIRYILDTQKRYPEGGITHAASFRRGEYTMVANDDDLWDPAYIERMQAYLAAHPEVDMCYSNGTFIDVKGHPVGLINTKPSDWYAAEHSALSNAARYRLRQNPIPFAFGLFRSEAYSRLLPFEDFDDLKANVDNVFVLKFFFLGLKCGFINEPLFFYRQKQRALDPKRVPGMPSAEQPLEIWLYYLLHQASLYRVVEKNSALYNLTSGQRRYFLAINTHALTLASHRVLYWIQASFIKPGHPRYVEVVKLLKEIDRLVKKALSDFPEIGTFSDDDPNAVRFHPAVTEKVLLQAGTCFLGMLEVIREYCRKTEPSLLSYLAKTVLREYEAIEDDLKRARSENAEALHETVQILKTPPPARQVSPTPAVTVISASKNLGRFLEDTIRSVGNQQGGDFEHVVVDGASSDETVSILKRYPDIRWVSEPDRGYPDALRKGMKMARGRYIIQCAVSDAFANEQWIRRSIEILDQQPEVSLVWGFPERLTEQGVPGNVSYPSFYHTSAPQKEALFSYWLTTGFFFPEGNLCVRRSVLESCYPNDEILAKNRLDWLAFSYTFHREGYLSFHLPIVANFGRTHEQQMGEGLQKTGKIWSMHKNYLRDVRLYRWRILLGFDVPVFKDGSGRVLTGRSFDLRAFRQSYATHVFQNSIRVDPRYLTPANYKIFLLKKLRYYASKLSSLLDSTLA